jgi:hypothetical protein
MNFPRFPFVVLMILPLLGGAEPTALTMDLEELEKVFQEHSDDEALRLAVRLFPRLSGESAENVRLIADDIRRRQREGWADPPRLSTCDRGALFHNFGRGRVVPLPTCAVADLLRPGEKPLRALVVQAEKMPDGRIRYGVLGPRVLGVFSADEVVRVRRGDQPDPEEKHPEEKPR